MAIPNPNLIYRTDTTGSLTFEQLDGNFAYLSQSIADITFVESSSYSTTASFVTLAQTASHALNAITSSFSTIAQNANTASFVTLSQTSSYIDPTFISASAAASGFGSGGNTIDTGSFATTGSNTFIGNQIISGSINFGEGSTIQSTGSTLELTPDASIPSDQYIVLDPTGPNHIHVRAGGVIDESNADLYLGGEKTNILVTDTNQRVQINTTAVDSSSVSWIFSNEGNTLFPTLTTPRGDTNSGDLIAQTLRLSDGTNEAVISTPDGLNTFPNSQRLVINPGQGSGSGEGGDIYLWAGRGGVDNGSGGDIKVRGGYGHASGSGGYVRIEGGDTTDGYAGFVDIKGGNSNTGQGGDVYIYGGIGNGYAQNGNIRITTYDNLSNAKNWIFGTNGTLTAPGNITANSFTGSLEGTASYTENAQTASYVNTLNQDVIISGSILISGSLIPDTDGVSVTSSFDLGSPTNAWKDIYVSNGTINFLDGAGNVQGTVGAGAAGTVITGALNVISYGDEELNLETQGYNGVFSKLSKQKLTSAGIKLAADYSTGLSLNYGLYTYFGDPILPWDRKINTFYVYNNLSSSVSPSLLYLPPINNAPYTPGEIITVYNISPSASSDIRNSGSLKISCFAQGILGVDTGSKNVTSAQNTQCPILSGSWGDFKSINPSSGYSASLEILPGKKVSFEVINWGNFSIGTSSNYPFYNGDFSGDGYSDATYGAIYKLISISDI